MIRTKSRIYGELNDPDTIESSATITVNKWLRGGGNKTISGFTPGPNVVLVTDGNGNISSLSLIGQYNKFICTDDEGNIVLIDGSEISD